MAKTEMIRARVEPELKRQAEELFSSLGLSTTEAITLFYKQVTLHRGLPFSVRMPNAETLEALEGSQARQMERDSPSTAVWKTSRPAWTSLCEQALEAVHNYTVRERPQARPKAQKGPHEALVCGRATLVRTASRCTEQASPPVRRMVSLLGMPH